MVIDLTEEELNFIERAEGAAENEFGISAKDEELWNGIKNKFDAARQQAAAARDRSPAGPDGRNLAVLYCLERAEADVKLLREALEGMIAVAEGRVDGNPHADIDALAKARAAQYITRAIGGSPWTSTPYTP